MDLGQAGISIGRDAQVIVGWGSPDEINVAQELLGEYTLKLKKTTNIYRQKAQNFTLILLLLLGTILIMMAPLFFLLNLININDFIIYRGLVLLFSGIALVICIITLFYYIRTRAYLEFLKEELSITKSQLERVVRVTSQVEDHVEHTPSIRLKLQLRLTESESAIRLADNVLRTRYLHPYSRPSIQARPSSAYSDLPASSNAS